MPILLLATIVAFTLPLFTPSYQPSLRDRDSLRFRSNGVTVIVKRTGTPPKAPYDNIVVRIEAWENGHRLPFEFQNRLYDRNRNGFVDVEGQNATAFVVPPVTLPGHQPDLPVIIVLNRTCGGSCGDWASAFEAHTAKDGLSYAHPVEAYLEQPEYFQNAQEGGGVRGRVLRIHYAKRINGNTFLTGVYDRQCRSFALLVNYSSSMAERDAPSGKAVRPGDFVELKGENIRVIRPLKAFLCSREHGTP